MRPDERWDAWQTLNEDPPTDDFNMDWARRGDGALMLQDEWGWFAMVTDEVGIIWAQDANPASPYGDQLFEVYCEPVWLVWADDWEYERDRENG